MAQIGQLAAQFDIGGLSDCGRQRRRNEDFWGRCEDSPVVRPEQLQQIGRLYLVSDGVGGNEDGDIASKEAIEQVMTRFYNASYPAHLAPSQRLERAMTEASQEIAVKVDQLHNNMAATLVAALFHRDRLIVANVGDSRAYIIRSSGTIEQLSVDHVEQGNQLTQAMGDRHLSIAFRELRLAPNDIVVLCTDGLHDLVRPHELKRIVARNPAPLAARQLIRLANRRAGHDNITAVIIRNGAPPRPVGLYLRTAAAAAAVAAAVMLLLGGLNTLAPVQARQVNQYLGMSRSFVAQLEPTATLSPLEMKATATTVYIQAEATRGIILPTLTPLAPAATKNSRVTPHIPPTSQPLLTRTTAPSAPSPRPSQPVTHDTVASATPATIPATASNPNAAPSHQPDSNPVMVEPPTRADPSPSAPIVPTFSPVPQVPVPGVQSPLPTPSSAPSSMPEAAQPDPLPRPTTTPGRVGRPALVSPTAPPVVPTSTPVPTSTVPPPTAPPVVPTSTPVPTSTVLPPTAPPLPTLAQPTMVPIVADSPTVVPTAASGNECKGEKPQCP